MSEYKCYCGEPAFAVVAGEEGYIVCFDHFFEQVKRDVESSLKQGVKSVPVLQIHCFFKDGKPVYLPYPSGLSLGQSKHCFDQSDNWANIAICDHEFDVAKAYESTPSDEFMYCKHCGVWKLEAEDLKCPHSRN